MDEQFQVFITVNETGEIMTCEVGQFIVRSEPADFFFMVDEETGKDLQVNAQYYKVVLVGFKPSLVKEEPPVEELPTEEESTLEEPTSEEPPVTEEPPIGEEEPPTEEPPVDEPVDETPVEEPTNTTE